MFEVKLLTAIFIYVFCSCKGLNEISGIDPILLADKVKILTENTLKYKEMQIHLDSLAYSQQSLSGPSLLNQLAKSFEIKFDNRVAAVKRLRRAVENAYSGSTSSSMQCCSASGLEHDSRFKQPVSTSKVCEQVSSAVASNAIHLQSPFVEACIDNLKNYPSLKWQYFGSEQGITTQFPANKATDCSSFDNRFRPWYVQANVPKSKQVVIVIDKSGSMSSTYGGVTYMTLAKEAGKSVVDTLNPQDQFTVISFSDNANVYTSYDFPNGNCYGNTFAQATPLNKKRAKEFINGLSHGGGTFYGKALNKAFNFFDNVSNSTSADRVILFMSDGVPSDRNAISTLSERNQQLGNTVVVMTYGMGTRVDFSVLKQMASGTHAEVGTETKAGVFTRITNPSMLRNEMASYYNFFSIRGSITTEPIWTVPYLDGWGLGLMITASLPVYVGGKLVGVSAVDITIEELFSEATYFKPTELTYTFVINEKGLIINHPLFPYVTTHDPLFVEATAFERDTEFLSIFESMKKGESGNKTFIATRILPQGDSKKYGVRELKVPSTYYWKQIPNTKFSLCLVLANDDSQALLQRQNPLPTNRFLYHRLDLVAPEKACKHLNNYCSLGQSAVAFAPRSFKDPELYLSNSETKQNVLAIGHYMEGRSSTSMNMKSEVRDAVSATLKAEDLWTAQQSEGNELLENVFWRYVATKEGIYRMFPGTQMPEKYDPVARSWYEYTQANREKYVITPPYRDAASRVSVVSFTRALYEGRPGGNHDPARDKLIGAMGVDIVTPYFHKILKELYPICNNTNYRCLLIDLAGYVIMADEFVSPTADTDKHITQLEATVADALIIDNILQRRSCSNIEDALIQRTFQIHPNQTRYYGSTSSCKNFQLIPVPETNAYLIALNKYARGTCNSKSTGICATCIKSTGPTCSRTSINCQCPCTVYNQQYNPCSNQYSFDSNSPPPCTPEIPDLTKVALPTVSLNSLPICYKIAFTAPLSTTTGNTEKGNGNAALIGGIVAGVIVVIILCYLVYRCYTRSAAKQATQESSANRASAPPSTQLTDLPIASNPAPPSSAHYGYNYPGVSAQVPTSNYNPAFNHEYPATASPLHASQYSETTKVPLPPSYNESVGNGDGCYP